MSRPTFRRRATAVATLSTLALGGLAASAHAAAPTGTSGTTATASSTTVLTKQVIPNLAAYTRLGDANPGQPLQVGVAVASPHAAEQAAYAKALYTPGSSDFHHFLTPAQRAARFGVDAATAGRIQNAVTARGLRVAYASPDNTYLVLTGTVGAVEQTFSVDEQQYRGADGSTFRANAQAPTVPSGVSAVLGLTSVETTHTSQDLCLQGTCTGIATAEDLWSAYDQPSSNLGTGQSVGIIGEGDINGPVQSLRDYEAFKGFPQVPVRRMPVADDQTDTSGIGEWEIDETAITGMAPNLASLTYYFGNDLTVTSYLATLQAWANDAQGPAIASSSIGSCEQLLSAIGEIQPFDAVLQGLVTEGRTLFNATGDTGGSCTVPALAVNGVSNSGVPTVGYPASSPYVVGVGGTVLYTTDTQPPTRAQEYGWTHSGGGTSYVEPAPAWQSDIATVAGRCVTSPGLDPSGAGVQCRGVPDVAALSGDVLTNGYETGNGKNGAGTSLSSPLWAGMWARVLAAHNSTCAAPAAGSTPGPIGFASPALYAVAKDAQQGPASFYDVAIGTNGQWTAQPRNQLNPTGYDYVGGLGVPDVTHLMSALDCGNTTPVAANPALPLDQTVSATQGGASCPPNGQLTDPTGDATIVSGVTPNVAAVNDDALDLTSVTITADANGITWKNHVTNLASDPGDLAFENYFTYGPGRFDLLSDNGALSGSPSFSMVSVDSTGNFTTVIQTLPGSFDPATNTVTITLPYAAYNTAVHPTTPLGQGSVLSGLLTYADRNAGGLLSPADTADFGPCTFTAPVPPAPTTTKPQHGHKK